MKNHSGVLGVFAMLSGVLFSIGAGFSGMTKPSKVLGFLDITGAWDPSLAFVMAGALLVYAPLLHLSRKRQPLLSSEFHLPTNKNIDGRLVIGAALFGIGWGVAGFCPGPAVVSLGTFTKPAAIFCAALISGMKICQVFFNPDRK